VDIQFQIPQQKPQIFLLPKNEKTRAKLLKKIKRKKPVKN
jgi:hypothetical protein